ncbi:MAG: ROK family transcriptional regulator [Alkalispirochaeta sp.]
MEQLQGKLIRPATMQEHNAYVVLQFIKHEGTVSRADIARSLGFSKSAISGIVSFLTTERLIQVVGQGSPRTGRKSELLSFDPSAALHVGVDLRAKDLNMAFIDLSGKVLSRVSMPMHESRSPQDVIDSIVRGYEHLSTTVENSDSTTRAMGLMVPGIVDPESGNVIYSSNLDWSESVNLSVRIERKMGIPVYLENDANALALAEVWVGRGADFSSIVYLYLGRRVGGAFVSKSQLFRGSSYAGVEAGKTIVCTSRGPTNVETALSGTRLSELFGEQVAPTEDLESYVMHLAASGELYQGDSEIIDYITDVFSQLVSNAIAMFNPDAVFIDTPVTQLNTALLPKVSKRVRDLLPVLPTRNIRVYPASLTREDEVIGGAALAMYRSRFRFLLTGRQAVE